MFKKRIFNDSCHGTDSSGIDTEHENSITVALAGNPNVGKSTIFNILTGLNQHVGNWPGKTVERKEGMTRYDGKEFKIIDLPGTYSLSSGSIEETIAANYIVREHPDVVVSIIDATNLERNMYLLTQIIETGAKVVVALNMLDLAVSGGIEINVEELERHLGIPVIPVIATKNRGIKELLSVINDTVDDKRIVNPAPIKYSRTIEDFINDLAARLSRFRLPFNNIRWVAIKILEGDDNVINGLKAIIDQGTLNYIKETQSKVESLIVEITDARYGWIHKIASAAVTPLRLNVITFTDKLDHLLTNQFLGLVILTVVLGLIFWLTFSISLPMQIWISGFFSMLGGKLGVYLAHAPVWLKGFLINGLIYGVGTVVSFFPLIFIFFIFLGILEDTGLLARSTFIMDRIMHILGLHGKGFICLLTGYGCNVPGIMCSRVLDNETDRKLSILINPFIPCSARFIVTSLFVSVFFPDHAALVMLSTIGISFAVVIMSGFIMRKTVLKGEKSPLIIELPLYRKPNAKTVGLYAWNKTISFLQRAGTYIVGATIVIWFLSHYPGNSMSGSVLGIFGRWIEPAGKLIGFSWRLIVALITGFTAKETSIATLTVLYNATDTGTLSVALKQQLTPLIAYVFIIFQTLYIPCLATVVTMKKELNDNKLLVIGIVYPLIVAFIISFLIYRIGLLIL
ncbi:MAG: ferrous iron transport protein B [Deltaproteobacteria bacterium]|nr:ferrous iron transport protein B [Deltaproteobacteria bacterium]MCL5792339.1 ferrous iron transport protein B [Deltaproteobacteria bacterium]